MKREQQISRVAVSAQRSGIAIKALSLAALVAIAPILAPRPAAAQQAGQPAPQQIAQATPQSTPKKAATPKQPASAPGTTAEKAPENVGRSRLDQLEQQMVDMQVAIGTLESLGRGGNNAGGNATPSRGVAAGIESGRVDALETQVRALAAQVDQLQQQIRQMSQQRGAQASSAATAVAGATYTAPPTAPAPSTNAQSANDSDPIGRIIGSSRPQPQQTANAATTGAQAAQSAAAPLIASDATSKQIYETAYGYLLAQDYGSAEAGFDEFLKRYPSDQLAGNAQYWLGETYFVRAQYKPAAAAFLKGYQTYARNAKAPDSLLKLAMSLDRLGQKDAACASFGELTAKFPNAPGHLKNRADSERRRLACA
ncbi:MAG: tol-pal system protein YbgF [Hyphomicrobiaceae bacterium]